MSKGISEKELAERLRKVPGPTPGDYWGALAELLKKVPGPTPDDYWGALAREAAAALGQPLALDQRERLWWFGPGRPWWFGVEPYDPWDGLGEDDGSGRATIELDEDEYFALAKGYNLWLALERRVKDALHLLECDQIDEAAQVLRGREEGA